MMSSAAPPVTRVAMDVTSLLGVPTGVGTMVSELVGRLPEAAASRPDGASSHLGNGGVEFTGYVVSLRGRAGLVARLPAGWDPRPLPYPARLAHRAWRSGVGQSFSRFATGGFGIGRHDVIHGPNYVVPPAHGAASRLVTIHDLTAWRFPELVDRHSRHYPNHLKRAIATGADVHTVSKYVAAELTDELGVPGDRVHVIRNGYTAGSDGVATRGRAMVGAPYVLALGTIEPRKDHVTLVRAMAELRHRIPDLQLVIAGADGWGTQQLNEVVEELGVADRIHRPGYVDDRAKADLLAGAELLAFPSRYEGFGFPVLEAMGAGTPVVSTTAGAIPEVAGGAAVLVAPGDPTALAEAMVAVVEDTELRTRLTAAGQRRITQFSWDKAAAELLGLYRRLTASRSSQFARR